LKGENVLNVGETPQPLRILCVQSKSYGKAIHIITGNSSFVDEFNFVDPHRLKAEPNLELNTTAYWMRQRFGVSPLFFSCFYSPKFGVKIGNASLIRTEGGKRVALGEANYCNTPSSILTVRILDGIYRFSSGLGSPVAHVWFSHSLVEGQSSTYIIHGCPDMAKNLILSYVEQRNPILMRPLSIDAILAEHSLHEWGQAVYAPRGHLMTYVRLHISHKVSGCAQYISSGKFLNLTIYTFSNCGSGRKIAFPLPASPHHS
jgi:hypothetical protein